MPLPPWSYSKWLPWVLIGVTLAVLLAFAVVYVNSL